MTQTEFLDALAVCAEQYRWVLTQTKGALRGIYDDIYDPITAVCYSKTGVGYPTTAFETAAEALGLAMEEADAMAASADNRPNHDAVLRQALLTAVGLAPAAGATHP